MFRISQFMEEIVRPTPIGPKRNPPGPVVIWNLIRRCNLACMHCYTNSYDADFAGELSTTEVFKVMDDLKAFRVPVIILSGGEPLLRNDIYDIAQRAKDMGFYVGLSSNGTFIDETNIEKIAALQFNYVGVSLDGIGEAHDKFRCKAGAFKEALRGIQLCKAKGIKVGIRYTLTQENYQEFPKMLQFMEDENIDKFYMSHLNYSGRGDRHRKDDAHFIMTREAMDLLFAKSLEYTLRNEHKEFVTGNNDADGVYLLHWVKKHFPEKLEHIHAKLKQWGGNSTGINIANIDNIGEVHPDSFWWDYSLGNVRQKTFSQIWTDLSDPLMAGLRAQPRTLNGRCGKCQQFSICNGNTRVRAYRVHKDFWAEDPGCYLNDNELGLAGF